MTLLIAAWLARIILIAVFAVAGVAKLAHADKTREMLAGFGVPARWLTILAVALPLVELAIAAALIVPAAAHAGALAAIALLTAFTLVITVSLAQGRRPDCNCFGLLGASPIGPALLIRNVALTGLALVLVVAAARAAPAWRLDLVLGVAPFVALAALATLVALLLLALIAGMQLAILQRLAQLQLPAQPGAALQALPRPGRGLPEGTLAPRFGLGDTRGDFVTLDQLLAPRRAVILLFTKPDCPPCAAMSNEVERWERDHCDQLLIVRISEGAADVEHYALVQANGDVASAYDCWGTPCAVLVTPDGRIGSPVAQGATEIRALVKRTAAAAALDGVRSA